MPEQTPNTPQPAPPKHWSAHVMWACLLLSATVILVAMAWNLGRRLALEHRIRAQAITTCVQLKQPPGQKTPEHGATHDACDALVTARHDECLTQYASDTDEHGRQRYPGAWQHAYEACLLSPSGPAGHLPH